MLTVIVRKEMYYSEEENYEVSYRIVKVIQGVDICLVQVPEEINYLLVKQN